MGRQSIMNQKKGRGRFRLVLVLQAFAVQIIVVNSKKVQKRPLDIRSFGKTNVKRCKIMGRFVLDSGPGPLSSLTRQWTDKG